jgi:hypothetical protein
MPETYELLFERYAGALVMRLGYGKKMETGEEPYARDILKVVHTVERVASPGAYLVDTFPILMLLPKWLAPFKQEAERLHDFEIKLFRGLLFEVRDKMTDGKAPKCFAKTFLERQAEFGLSDDEGAYVIGTLFEAGTGTTAAAMMSFVLSMCHYPEWQQKIQQEVDQVVGDERMPDFSDIPQLPTIRAVAKETLRWRPVTAGGVPHELIKDDVYDGFYFPAGTNVHANQWCEVSFLILSSTDANTVLGPFTGTQICIQTQKPSIPIVGYPPSIQLFESHSTSSRIYRTSQHSALGVAFVQA